MEELLKKLKVVGTITDFHWNTSSTVRKWFTQNPQSLISFKHGSRFDAKWSYGGYAGNDYRSPKIPSKYLLWDEAWYAYENSRVCKLTYNHKTGNLEAKITIFDRPEFGNTYIKWEAIFIAPYSILDVFSSEIKHSFEYHMEDLYAAHLQSQKELWINRTSNRLLHHNYD